jgi:O-antigen ligase
MREGILSSPAIPLTSHLKAPAARRIGHLLPQTSISPFINCAFYAFVFSILFEGLPIGIPAELTQVTGAVLLLLALLQPYISFRHFPAALWCFIAYLYVGALSLLLRNAWSDGDARWAFAVILQLAFFFWLAYNLMRQEQVVRGALLALIASCLMLSVLQTVGLAIPTITRRALVDRFASFGLDPNQLACILSLGLLALVGLTFGSSRSTLLHRFLVWPLYVLVAATIVQTGSRGGILAFAAGLITLLLGKGTVWDKTRNLLIVLLGITMVVLITFQSDAVSKRFDKTLDTGDLAAREQIYPAAWQMFLEKPLLGWGIHTNTYEIEARVAMANYNTLDAHNLILYVLTSAGLVGAIPFFLGIGLCALGAWKARAGPYGGLPFAMTVTLLMADMSASGLRWKHHWLILAFALASGANTAVAKTTDRRLEKPRSDRRAQITA